MIDPSIKGKPTDLRYVIRGANRDTGESISIVIDAQSATEAERQANDLGILVAEVAAEVPVQPAAAIRPPTARPTAPPKRATNGLGLAGFILSVVGLATWGFLSPVALIVSAVSISKRPRGFATWGLILSGLGCLWLVVTVAGLLSGPIDSFESTTGLGSDLSDTSDDLIINRPKPIEIADEGAHEAERRQAELADRERRLREQEAEAERIAHAPQTLEVQVLKWYMASQSHAALDIRFINTSNAYLGAWSVSVELYDATGRYLGSNTVMTVELRPGKAKVEQCVFTDTNVGDIAKWTVTLDAVVGESGLRVDRQFELQVSAP